MKHSVVKQGMQAATIALVTGVLVCSLGGCVMVRDNGEQERIAQLERELDELRSQQDQADKGATTDSSKDAADAKDSSKKDAAESADNSAADPSATTSDATVKDFSARADDLIARSKDASVPADRSAKVDAFLALDAEFDALDIEMDAYEDKREAEYRAGKLDWEEYRAIDQAIEAVEHRLDAEQDSLEHRFGMDN